MITFAELPGVDINIALLISVGLGAGVLSGFAGVGGAFIVTPALIVLGFPANLAVGTSMAWIMGNSIIGMLTHRKIGNVDMKFGVIMIVAAMCGTETGVRILNSITESGTADQIVLTISISLLVIVGSYTLIEAIRRKSILIEYYLRAVNYLHR